jgi:uncharacterized phage protein (TIGR01671 family)
MREILFRGKRVDTGGWVEGSYYKRTEYYGDPSVKHYIIVSTEDLSYDQALEYYEVIPETVGQYTGLKDKDGIKIFEGDVCERRILFGSEKYEIRFERGTFGHREIGKQNFVTSFDDNEFGLDPEWFEVIGNIHDNPELLEVK